MAEMDVYEQVASFYTEFRERSARNPTKFTIASDIRDWFVQLLPTVVDPASMTTLMGVPCVIDDEFWPGQLRIHRGEEFEDHFVIVPRKLSGYAFFAHAGEDQWRPLGLVQDLTIQPPGA